MQNTQIFFFIIVTIFFFLFIRNVLKLIFGMENDSIHKRRLKELNFDGSRIGQSQDQETKAFLNKVTEPVVKYLLPNIKTMDSEKLRQNLKFIEWDKWIDVPQFKALDIILKIVGVLLFFLLLNVHIAFSIIVLVLMFFGLRFMLKNSVANKKSLMFSQFPEFIRLTQGYLSAEMRLAEAIDNTIDFVGDEWKPYLKRFTINANLKDTKEALRILQEDIDIFEVKELLSLIRVAIDQGIDIKESFESQTEKVRAMQLEIVMKKIEKRKMMGILLQGPLLLTIIIAFALPTVSAMMNI